MKVKVLPLNVEFQANSNQSLLEQLLAQGFKIRSLCKGVPSCAECRILIKEGAQNLLPPTQSEIRLVGNTFYLDGKRLACQCRLFGPLTIDISEHLIQTKEVLRKIRGIPEESLEGGKSHAVIRTLILDPGLEEESTDE